MKRLRSRLVAPKAREVPTTAVPKLRRPGSSNKEEQPASQCRDLLLVVILIATLAVAFASEKYFLGNQVERVDDVNSSYHDGPMLPARSDPVILQARPAAKQSP
jgi:hypothetical protein